VAGHYECIGVPGGEEEVFAFLTVAIDHGAARDRDGGGREILWRDPSGASVAVDTAPDGEIVCARPSFLGSSRLPVLVNGIGEDPECRFCSRLFADVLDEDGEMVYPLAVELEEIDAVLEAVPKEERRTLRVTAFADSIETWPGEEAYNEAVSDEEARFAARSLIPVGFFTTPARRGLLRRAEPVPAAHALLTGIVASFAERRNEATGHSFLSAELDTFGGRYDAVVASEEAEELGVGAVVQLECWLIGSLEPA
jgi:hypothetical protein